MYALFLTTPEASHNDNHTRLPAAFAAGGWQVHSAPVSSLRLEGKRLYAGNLSLSDYDLIWPVGFGSRGGFLDRQQLLSLCPTSQLINDPLMQTTLHAKTVWLDLAPLSMVAQQRAELGHFMRQHGGAWVLKPTAASYGAEVYKVENPEQLQTLVDGNRYWLLQRYLPEIIHGETRTLVAGGTHIGSYLRKPRAGEFRANMAQGAEAVATVLSAAEQDQVNQVVERLNRANIGFAAVDTCAGYVLEVNVANPGGLATLAEVYGRSFDADLVAAVTQSAGDSAPSGTRT